MLSDDELRELIADWERNRRAAADARAALEERVVHERVARDYLLAAIRESDGGTLVVDGVLYRACLVQGGEDIDRKPVRVIS